MPTDLVPGSTPPADPAAIRHAATLIYNYHRMSPASTPPPKSDAIFVLCSLDTRVAVRGAELYLAGVGSRLIFSGGVGALTRGRFRRSEADEFAAIAMDMGVPADRIIVEARATNTGENVRFTYDLLRELGLRFASLVLVQKPYMERRTYATFVKQWPDPETRFSVTSPGLGWEEYPDEENPRELVISIMVGDLVRIREYAVRGFQAEMEVPEEVWEAGQFLIRAGYDAHLPK